MNLFFLEVFIGNTVNRNFFLVVTVMVKSGNCCQVENHDQGELNELNDLNVKWEPCKCVMLNVPLE